MNGKRHLATDVPGVSEGDDDYLVRFLNVLPQLEPRVSAATARAAICCWREIRATVEVRIPLFQPTPEGYVQLAWHAGVGMTSVEIDGNLLYWFGTHRDTGLRWEVVAEPGKGLPGEVVSALDDLPKGTE